MRTKIRDILIISAILLGLAFVFGCKDEAKEKGRAIYNRALTASEVAQIYEDPFYEPNEPKLTYTAEELDEIYKGEPALGKLAKDLWRVAEPNKPEGSKQSPLFP